MHIDFLLKVFAANTQRPAIVWREREYEYGHLLDRVECWRNVLERESVRFGSVTILEAGFSPNSVSLFLALAERGCVIVPLTSGAGTKKKEFADIAEGEVCISVDQNDGVTVGRLRDVAHHEIYRRLNGVDHPGLVLFSSGSTGRSKAAVHDLVGLLEKFRTPRHCLRTMTFLLYDHIGGINTMLYALSNAGCIVTTEDHRPDAVLSAIERHRVELLPTSPTFLNMVLLSEAFTKYDLRSLKVVTYGTEPMPESTLRRFYGLFPNIRLLQTYGLSEVGILRSKSKSSDSLWVKIGGEGYQTRVVNGILHIKARSAMLGYLNAPDPFTEDGWFNTGDAVELDGEYIKILGRESDIINVGGEKVYPAELESVIQELDNIAEVCVYREKNPIVGQIVCAKVKLIKDEDEKALVRRLKLHCRQRVQHYKVPVKVVVVNEEQHSERFKKRRPVEQASL
jgi:long-chain acyl-CoA synthetase